MKILYTGANGLLGQKISVATSQYSNHAFLATARGANRTKYLGTAAYASMDITDRTEIKSVLSEFRADVIVHGAAMTHVDECEKHKELAYRLNVVGTQNIVDAAKEINAHLIFISTDFIFDGQDGPYDENGVPNPISYYGETKLQAERIVQTVDTWSIIRTALVIGIAEDLSRSNIILWAKGALEKAQPIRIVSDQFRSPTLAEDLAQGALLVATQRAQGIFNISGPDFMSIYQLVEAVAKYFGLSMANVDKVNSSMLNQPAMRPPRTGFDISKAIQILGYRPHSLEEALEIIAQQAGL